MRRLALAYGMFGCLLTAATCLALALFLNDAVLPISINANPLLSIDHSTGVALAVDALLLVLFGLQHSGMARESFKRVWTRFVPPPIERSTYVLASCAALVVLMACWQPWPASIWRVEHPAAYGLIQTAAAVGVGIVIAAAVQLDHLELLGLRQVWDWFRGQRPAASAFRTPGLYRFVRHPLMLGLLLFFWAAPALTAGRLLFNVGMTLYILTALRWEERDLRKRFGEHYANYQRRVPQLLPWKWPGA